MEHVSQHWRPLSVAKVGGDNGGRGGRLACVTSLSSLRVFIRQQAPHSSRVYGLYNARNPLLYLTIVDIYLDLEASIGAGIIK